MDVVGAPVTVEPLRQSVQLVGTFQAPEELQVVAKVGGEVLSLPAREGSPVQKGDLLATIDDRKIKARLDDARARRTLAQATLDRAEGLRRTNSISVQEFDEARSELDQATATIDLLQAEFDDTRMTAQIDGVISEHLVSVGQVVPVGQELMTLVKLDPLEISFEVPERYLAVVEEGLTVNIRTDVYEQEVFTGELVYLAPRLRTTTRTLPVKASVPNPDGKLRPGMFGKVELVLSEIPDALFVPESAVMQQGSGNMIVVRNPETYRSEFRPVEVGVRQGGRMQIVSGLSPGDQVVAEGTIKMFYPGMLLNFTEDSRNYGLEPSMAPTPVPAEPSSEATTDEH
jgi:membrane fusion protein (multidrug efflux system)